MRVVGALASAGLALGLGLVVSGVTLPAGTTPPLTVLALLCVSAAALSFQLERDPLSPLLLFAVIFVIFYVLRPLYVLAQGSFGPARIADDQSVTHAVLDYMSAALWIAAAAVLAFVVGYTIIARRTRPAAGVRRVTDTLDRDATALVLLATSVVAIAVFGLLIRDAGGIHAYINQLSVRSGFFFGRAYLTAAILPFKVAALTLIAVLLQRRSSRSGTVFAGALFVLVGLGDFLTGGRAAFVLGTAIPVALLAHRLRKRLSLRVLVSVGSALVVFVIAAQVITRDSVYLSHPGKTRASLVISALEDVPKSTVGSRDFVAFDSLTTMVEAKRAGNLPLLWGRSYADTLAFPIPRALWPGKPAGGGNAWFTSRLFPAFYGTNHVETSVSMIGEAYGNFGVAGVCIIVFVVGLLAALLSKRIRMAHDTKSALMGAVSLGYLLELSRGDAYHAVSGWALSIALVQIIVPLCVRGVSGAEATTAAPTLAVAGRA